MMRPNADLFRKALAERFRVAELAGHGSTKISAGDLHNDVVQDRSINQMPNCCRIMINATKPGDEVLPGGPPSGQGANFTIVYRLPRPQ
jgi:hypothetical protein